MFLGGLILNLMPCVFPVIGLKIMGFVQQAGSDRKKIVMHGVVFTLGVLASFAVLSGILFAARGAAGGDSIGWGYQLQNPWVVVSLMLLMFLLGLNMFGLFEIGASATSVGGSLQTKQGLSGSFFSGILATVVATPCSAPFLGAAIGAAIALPAVPFFTAFAAMAIGLSTPYLVLSIFPKLIDLLPRPGAWMESFKQGMSFLLFATAGYLLWVYAGQIDLDNLLNPIFGLSAIAAAAWIYGRWNLPHLAKRSRVIGVTLASTIAIVGLFLVKPPKPSSLEWLVWSPEKVEEIIKEGKPVYIDFTAKWCVTCQANKKFAYTEEVIALANKKQVVFLKADKTKPNPTIEKKLRELNRTAIPVNVLMIPGEEPIITPEILTPQILTDLFNKAPDPANQP
jgi:thiol:disulfide interchange protein DsbD